MTALEGPARDTRRRLDDFRVRRGLAGGSVERLVQDAGERVYFRVRPESKEAEGPRETLVLCVMARPYEPGTLPFADSAALYRALGVRAPEIRGEAPDLGVVALEDLGDDLLQQVALRKDPRTPALYDEAVGILARIQREGARIGGTPEGSRFRAFSMRLDATLFFRELRFFVEHFIEGHLGLRLGAAAARELDHLLAGLAEEAAAGPEALCHRDYHSRNLIAGRESRGGFAASGSGLRVIDHQDTRLGPRGYDLMSLLRDPYVATAVSGGSETAGASAGFALPFVEAELVSRFREAAGLRETRAELVAEFDAVALQRNLKALGTYGFQVFRRGNEVYDRFIPPTLGMVRENLDRHRHRPDRRALRGAISRLMDLG